MSSPAIDTKAAVKAAKTVTGTLSTAGKTAVLDHLVSELKPQALKALSPKARGKLLNALAGTEAAPSATTFPAVAELKLVDGHPAVVGKITVKGHQLDTLLPDRFFNKSRRELANYAERLGGYRFAHHEENLAYVEGLLAKEVNDTINDAEKDALQTYRNRYVRDSKGGLNVAGRRVDGYDFCWDVLGVPSPGALFVRASAESK